MDRVAVALGSNLGDRVAHLNHAILRLRSVLRDVTVSRFRETVPVDVHGPQPLYLNAAAAGSTTLPPRAILEALLGIERERGRERPVPKAARTLDLDLILYGGVVLDEPDLIIPHPRFRDRRFVLEPLAEVAPDLVDPVTRKSIGELLAACS